LSAKKARIKEKRFPKEMKDELMPVAEPEPMPESTTEQPKA
jgi:hypothetical protein